MAVREGLRMKTINLKFNELCDEIDYWKDEAEHYRLKYEKLHKEYIGQLDKSTKDSMDMCGKIFSVMLRSEQTEKGVLIKNPV